VEVARMIMSEEIDDANPKKLNCLILKSLLITMNNKNFSLFPFDVINIRKMAVYENQRWLPLVGP
jgi:hypothetical protein